MKQKLLLLLFPMVLTLDPVWGVSTFTPGNFEKKKTESRSFDSAAKSSLALGLTTVLAMSVSPVLAVCLGCSAFIYGRQAIRRIWANPEELRGKRLAEAGIVIGSVANPLGVLFLGGWLIADKMKRLFRRRH